MPTEDCEGLVAGAAGLSKAAARKMLEAVDQRAQRLQRDLGLSPADATARAGQEIADQAAAVAAVQRRNQLMNLQKRMARRAKIESTAETLGGKNGVDLVRAIRNTMVSINTPVRGGRMSAEAEAMTWHDRYLSGVTNELERQGLFKAARSNAFQREWGRELYELSMRDAGQSANPGVTGNKAAISIAATLHKYMTWAKGNLNREGAWIGDYAGYISRTVHDGDKMRRAGQEAWISSILPLLDRDRTFEGVDNPDAFLRGTYNALVTGIHLSDEGGVGFKDPAFTGPANIAQKMSEARVLHFKDANAWLDYQEQFGSGTLLEQVFGSLGRAAHSQALLSRWGTNPAAEFDQVIRWVQEKYRDSHTAEVDRLGQRRAGLQAIFDTLTGEANRPANRLAAKIGSYVRLDESLAKLGMVAFTHLSSLVNKAGEVHYQGVPWMQAYGDFFASPFRSMGSAEARAWADETLAGMEGTNRDILSGFNANDSVPGTASRLANLFFKLSGLTWLLNKQKAGAEWAISRRAGMNLGSAFADLPAPMQRAMGLYDITPAEWDVLRQAPDHVAIDGRQFLTPQAAMRAPDEAFAAMMGLKGADAAPAPGLTRFYHGGQKYDGGPRWMSPDLEYARGYAAKSPGAFVHYLDVPNDSPMLSKTFDDTGTDVTSPFASFEAPADMAAGLKRYGEGFSQVDAQRIEQAREALALKVHGWLHDTADRSVVSPGVEDRALITGATRPGTMAGEFWRFIAQFKMWPVAAIRQQWGRDLYGTPGDTMGKVGGIMNLLLGSMVSGYAVMTLKDLLKGQNPRSPLDPKTAVAAVMQGGGLGLAGDYLFGEYNRFGQSPTEAVLGPVLGANATVAIDLWNRIKAHAEGSESASARDHPLNDIGPDAIRLLTDNLPFVNLFYTRQALNYLFLYSLQETMRPGYLRRAEKGVKDRTGTTMWMSPAEHHLHTFGR